MSRAQGQIARFVYVVSVAAMREMMERRDRARHP
jgi:hypothetical protein